MEAGRRQWQAFEFAVAWVNRGGAERIEESARDFLGSGGRMRATVGLDFGSTSYEGLGKLLDLEGGGSDIITNVFCDENPACTFHPKIFLFSNAERARLFIGSNNMTGAGLDANVEAALGFSGALNDETIRGALHTLATWRDEANESRTLRLTRQLLEQLRDRRYVLTEEELRNRRNVERGSRSSMAEPLFGRSQIRPRRVASGSRARATAGESAARPESREVLLMRVRPRRNGNQVQISMRVLEASFMKGAEDVVSIDGSRRVIGYNIARGVRNTARFEAPEMTGMQEPVARFQWVHAGHSGRESERVLQYEILDAGNNPEGLRILRKLEEGIATPPVTNLGDLSPEKTVLSTSDRESAQWYRLDSN